MMELKNNYKGWSTIIEESNKESELIYFVNNFFLRDMVDINKFYNNYKFLFDKAFIDENPDYLTDSIFNIERPIPPYFSHYFVAGYPDVFNWFQENALSGKIPIFNHVNNLSDEEQIEYFQNQKKIVSFYKDIIKSYKKNNLRLETKIDQDQNKFEFLKIGKLMLLWGVPIGFIFLFLGAVGLAAFLINFGFWIGGGIWILDIKINNK